MNVKCNLKEERMIHVHTQFGAGAAPAVQVYPPAAPDNSLPSGSSLTAESRPDPGHLRASWKTLVSHCPLLCLLQGLPAPSGFSNLQPGNP